MTTVRLTPDQKRKLERALKVMEAYRGRRLSRGEAIGMLADRALRRPAELAEDSEAPDSPWKDDPLFSPDLGWDFGKTDAKSVDRLVYGRR